MDFAVWQIICARADALRRHRADYTGRAGMQYYALNVLFRKAFGL